MKAIEYYLEQHRILLFFALFLFFACVLFLFRNTGLIVDEHESLPQIINFTNGDFRLLEISAMPGYHAVMAILVKISGQSSVFVVRCITTIFGFITAILFFKINRRIHNENGILKTIQFVLFPSIFLYFFMIYTDILSLMLVMLMLLFSLNKRYALAGLFGILSMLVRQNNVIWTAFIPAVVYFETNGFSFSMDKILSVIRKTWVFFAGFALFILFVIINKGVALGDSSSHPAFQFSTGNLFFMLFVFFVFFLPMNVANIPKIIELLKSNKWALLFSLVLFVTYWFTFKNDHPYNQIEPHYFLRNLVLTRFTASEKMRLLFFFPMLFAFWSMAVTELSRKEWYLIYFFAILFLLPSWLIEQRYYIIPFMLFMLFKKNSSVWVDIVTILYFIIILCWLMPLVVSIRAFL